MKFSDVMDRLPMEALRTILNNPQPVSQDTFTCMAAWMGVRGVDFLFNPIDQLMVDSRAFTTLSEARRKIKQGGVKWNGKAVTDSHTTPEWIWPGWGILALGKKQHWLVAINPN
jgi:hypothetical protein